ncbi:MAG: hypothetical protein K2F91_09255 [Muribaculaceae bacterium]|nr:hypothetical protein [Muribaculaceae bacterium]
MKILFIISTVLLTAMLLLSGLALFDIVDMSQSVHGIVGIVAVVSLAVSVKAYIRLYKSTRRF